MARPVQFDREAVLNRAMHAFWEHGYAATSMATLLEETRLKPGSLYAAFQSKEALFLASLDHYAEQSLARISDALHRSESPMSDLRDYLQGLAESSATATRKSYSCLLVNTALELSAHNVKVKERVDRHLGEIEALFRECLERAQACEELGGEAKPEDLAAYIMTMIWGLRVLGGTASDPARAYSVVRQLLQVLDG